MEARPAAPRPVSVVATDRAAKSLDWVAKTPFEAGLETTIEWATKTLSAVERFRG